MLEDKLYALASFRKQYDAILILSACESISSLECEKSRDELISLVDWNNVLGIASALSQSENSLHLDAALRIAQTCISLDSCNLAQKSAAAYILENLTNTLAIKMSIDRQYMDDSYNKFFSFQQKIDVIKTHFSSSIFINNKLYLLNKFQSEVYNKYINNEAISISAPTSAGKSYILYAIIAESLLRDIVNIVYIVPTRALISQVETDLIQILQESNLKDNVNISTVPLMTDELDLQKSNIFIFTQERLHWFLANNTELSIRVDLLIIDEAHKIEDGNRGILLQQKLEELVSENEHMKIYFSSPFTSNPEILLDNIYRNIRKDVVNTQFVAVNQNLIFASQAPRNTLKWNLSLNTYTGSFPLGYIALKDRPNNELKKIALIAHQIGKDGSCIIYSNGAAEAEKIADLLYDVIDNQVDNANLHELIRLVKDTVNTQYTLAKVLEKGIAFHYGNMPLLIRKEIEKLFSSGVIHYLICTSTLLEGVNLPAKSIIIRKPRRGKTQPLNANDFWNLAGRAGRWGKEFCGNIICIEPNEWEIPPTPNKTRQVITRAIDNIANNSVDFLDYIDADTPRANMNPAWESACGYYYIKYIINKEQYDINDEFQTKLVNTLNQWASRISIPDYIIKRNPGISPIAQQRLFEYFEQHHNCIEEYVPVYPQDSNALIEYTNLIHRIGETLSNYPQNLDTSRAILLINWMTGRPLSYMIKKSFESYQRNPKYKESKNIHVVIREVMDNIETFVRFSFAKDSSCYMDILRYYLEINQRNDLINNIPQLNLWLEFGVSEKTHLSLLSLGLSRNTVIALSDRYITNTQMSQQESFDWLRQLDLDALDVSTIIKDDIRRIL